MIALYMCKSYLAAKVFQVCHQFNFVFAFIYFLCCLGSLGAGAGGGALNIPLPKYSATTPNPSNSFNQNQNNKKTKILFLFLTVSCSRQFFEEGVVVSSCFFELLLELANVRCFGTTNWTFCFFVIKTALVKTVHTKKMNGRKRQKLFATRTSVLLKNLYIKKKKKQTTNKQTNKKILWQCATALQFPVSCVAFLLCTFESPPRLLPFVAFVLEGFAQ